MELEVYEKKTDLRLESLFSKNALGTENNFSFTE